MQNKITILDGGLGQEIIKRSGRELTPMWSAETMLNDPDVVRDVHIDFIKAGAEIITLNTYTATPARMERDSSLRLLQPIHLNAIKAAQDAIEETGVAHVKIAGCLPPLVASYVPEAIPDDEEALKQYRQLVELQDEACDLFLCETMSTIREAMAALTAAEESGKPCWVAFTLDDEGDAVLRSGERLQSAIQEISALKPDAVLLNCSAPETMNKALPVLQTFEGAKGVYANAFETVLPLAQGETVDVLKARLDVTPENYAAQAEKWVQQGISIIGGCCEVGPEHIRILAEKIRNH